MKMVTVASNQEEAELLRSLTCSCGGRFKYSTQKLFDPSSGRYYDEVSGLCRRCSSPVQFMVDITSFFSKKKWAVIIFVCGMLLLLFLLLAVDNDPSMRAGGVCGVLAMALFIVVFARTLFTVRNISLSRQQPAAAPSAADVEQAILSDKDRAMLRRLEELDIAANSGPGDPGMAFIGGAAKASISFGLQKLDQKQYEEAAESFEAALGILEKQDAQQWKKVIAAAHYLKGQVFEAKGMGQDAAAEYNAALAVVPDYRPALAAVARTQQGS